MSAARGKERPADAVAETPLLIGLAISALLGVVLFLYGLYSFTQDAQLPYSTALVVCGFLAVILSWYTRQRSRVAWSFLLSIDGTATLVFLFGASKVRDAFDIPLSIGLLPSVAFGIATALVATTQAFRS